MTFKWGTTVRAVAMTAVVFLHAVSTAAQDVPEQLPPVPATMAPAPRLFGQARFGALSLAPTLSIREIGYDTNVFDVSGDRKPGDFTATLEPGIELGIKTRTTDVRTLTRVAFIYYQTYKSEQAINPKIDLTVVQRLSSHLKAYANGSYGYSKERTGYEVDSRERSRSQETTAGVRVGGRKLEVDLHGVYNTRTYDDSAVFLNVTLAQTLNKIDTGGGVGAAYALSPYTSVTARADELIHRFPVEPGRDMNETITGIGVRFSPRAVIAGDASIGYTRTDPVSPLTPVFSGITPRAGVTYKLHDILSLGFGAERGIESSFYSDRPYYLFNLYETSATVVVFGRFDISGGVQYTTLDYQSFLKAITVAPSEVVRMESVGVGAPIKKGVHLGVFGQRWQRVSQDRPYDSLRFGFYMTVGPAAISPRGIFLAGPLR